MYVHLVLRDSFHSPETSLLTITLIQFDIFPLCYSMFRWVKMFEYMLQKPQLQ